MKNASLQWTWVDMGQKERRLHARVSQPWVRIETQGFAYIALDWSTGGAAIDHFHDAGPVGALVSGQLGWAATDNLFAFTGDIVRKTPEGITVLRWLDIPADFLAQLDEIARRR